MKPIHFVPASWKLHDLIDITIRKQDPTLEELIHHHQVTGNFQDALACYSSLGRQQKDSLALRSGMLRCYLEMDQPSTAAMLVKGKDLYQVSETLKKLCEFSTLWVDRAGFGST